MIYQKIVPSFLSSSKRFCWKDYLLPSSHGFSVSSGASNEVEKKFKPLNENLKLFDKNASSKKHLSFVDIYFDNSSYELTKKDMWLRLRSNILELKWPASHSKPDSTIDFYSESTDKKEIVEVIREKTNDKVLLQMDGFEEDAKLWLKKFDLEAFATIKTNRTRYDLRVFIDFGGKDHYIDCYADIDQVEFLDVKESQLENNDRYLVGEIELHDTENNKKYPASMVFEKVFHKLKIDQSPTPGKVLEYLHRYRPNHYSSLKQAGLIGNKLGQKSQFHTKAAFTKETSPSQLLLRNNAVNFHFTRKCNFECKFCFHTDKTSHVLQLDDMKRVLDLVKQAGAAKVNFAGGEPFLQSYRTILGELVKHSKLIGFSSVSIITNGSQSKCYPEWFRKYGEYLDILGMSIDTVNPETNFEHGRKPRGALKDKYLSIPREIQMSHAYAAANICKEYQLKFKINTVVTNLNKNEDMSEFINEINPFRWKVFQVLPMIGENCGDGRATKIKQDVTPFLITDMEFESYLTRHIAKLKDSSILKPESNELMQSSYILIDEYGRYLDCSSGAKLPTSSILDVGIDQASLEILQSSYGGFDRQSFFARDGYYPDQWSKLN